MTGARTTELPARAKGGRLRSSMATKKTAAKRPKTAAKKPAPSKPRAEISRPASLPEAPAVPPSQPGAETPETAAQRLREFINSEAVLVLALDSEAKTGAVPLSTRPDNQGASAGFQPALQPIFDQLDDLSQHRLALVFETLTDAVLNSIVLLGAVPTEASRGSNDLSAIGNTFSFMIRRVILLTVLQKHEWNLTRTARELNLPSHSNVLREIKALTLEKELEAARAKHARG